VKIKEPDPVIYEHLGDALVKSGNDQDALAAWEKALQLDPAAEGVKKKVDDLKDRQRRVKGGPKASQ
jgi:predicted negative regulator of RcsB-dependent stress response